MLVWGLWCLAVLEIECRGSHWTASVQPLSCLSQSLSLPSFRQGLTVKLLLTNLELTVKATQIYIKYFSKYNIDKNVLHLFFTFIYMWVPRACGCPWRPDEGSSGTA